MCAKNPASVGLVNIQDFIADAKCFEKLRELRWPEVVRCAFCGSEHIIKYGRDETQGPGSGGLQDGKPRNRRVL